MDFKLIVSTFFVIFLAELGDKTQFAAMAASAGSSKPVSILIGTVLALTVSSVIAVAAGSLIGGLIPVKYIKIAAGVLFIIFGLLYIRESFTAEPAPAAVVPESSGLLGETIIKAAKTFEEEELDMLIAAAESIDEHNCKTLLNTLIREERKHLNILNEIEDSEAFGDNELLSENVRPTGPFACGDDCNDILLEVHKRELAMADFYRIMSEKTRLESVRNALHHLHEEEEKHAESIMNLIVEA